MAAFPGSVDRYYRIGYEESAHILNRVSKGGCKAR